MSRRSAPSYRDRLVTVRVRNLAEDVKPEDLIREFRCFGAIGDIFQPIDRGGSMLPKPVIFIRFFSEESAQNAIDALNGKAFSGEEILVDWAHQDSYFSSSTGYITNWEIVEAPVEPPDFDPSLPDDHYAKKREQEIIHEDNVYSVRVDDLSPEITPELLKEVFGQYGEISRVYCPIDLLRQKRKDFAFVRYLRERDAREAVANLNNTNLGFGRSIRTTYQAGSGPTRYFSDDRVHTEDKKRYRVRDETKRINGVALYL